MIPYSSTFVLFVDMLGFSNLVDRQGEEIDDLNPVHAGVELYSPSQEESLLGFRFINFHRCLNQARMRLQEMGAGTAIVFSDSAFLRMDKLEDAFRIAKSLMQEMVISEVPVRMGLAKGSYRMLRFLSDSSAQVSFHMAQFLGTGIVNAYRAERCGAAGLRILLHPNIEPLLVNENLRVVPIAQAETKRLPVKFEINYLGEEENHLGAHYQDCIEFDCLNQMERFSDDEFRYHYHDTFTAWNNMRAQYGRDPYPIEKYRDRDEYDYSLGIRSRPASEG